MKKRPSVGPPIVERRGGLRRSEVEDVAGAKHFVRVPPIRGATGARSFSEAETSSKGRIEARSASPSISGRAARRLVSVVDDDESVRESLPDLLKELGFDARAFSSAEQFLASEYIDATECLILDIAMPGMSGPDLHRELAHRGRDLPVVYVTALSDETVRPRMLELGAVECLFKPFSDIALREALEAALG
jgi:CheY-like chemotaxis protein